MNKKYNNRLTLLVMGLLLAITSSQSNLYGFSISNFYAFFKQNSIGATLNSYYQQWMPTIIQKHPLLFGFTSLSGIGLFAKYVYPKLFVNKKDIKHQEFIYSQNYNVPKNPKYDIKASTYEDLKTEFTTLVKQENILGILELLILNTHPQVLRDEMCEKSFYEDIFEPLLIFLLEEKEFDYRSLQSLLNILLADKMSVKLGDTIFVLPGYSDKQKEFITYQLAQLFNTNFSSHRNNQKLELASLLMQSPLGNAILCKWLELDPLLPYTKGTITRYDVESYENVTSAVNLIQWMLRCYALHFDKNLPLSCHQESRIDDTTMSVFIKAWKKFEKQDNHKAYIHIPSPSVHSNTAVVDSSLYYLKNGTYETTLELAKTIKLDYLFKNKEQ